MFESEELKNHLETSSTIEVDSRVISEWNMNVPENIFMVGNYRYRPNDSDVRYRSLPLTFDQLDLANYYTGATDADVVINGGTQNNDTPQLFTTEKEKLKLIYSLEDCISPFRPRSGINKATFFSNLYFNSANKFVAQRPRYYMASRDDQFKYWTSYRTESGIERGISNASIDGTYYIEDAAPFVVYKENVPTNKIVVKMQTHVGDVNLGPFRTEAGEIQDPFFGEENKRTPVRWKIQILKDNSWIDAISFNENSTRSDGTPIINHDGYVEISYGLLIPEAYQNSFIFAGQLSSTNLLPEKTPNGYAYLIVENDNERGTIHIYNAELEEYETFTPDYGWRISEQVLDRNSHVLNKLVNPDYFIDQTNNSLVYRELAYIRGMRIVVETMNVFDATFDLIEMSPRLIANLSDKVLTFNIKKSAADLSSLSLPVGNLLASTGSIELFDEDLAFNENNEFSIISKYADKRIQITFYEVIKNVNNTYDYFVPIKSLYSDGFPQSDETGYTVSMELRDKYFLFESMPAPQILLTEVSLSYAISVLMDYIGFTNYTFKRLDDEDEPIIPYFFVAPDQSVAEVLVQLAVATQSAMFFDEYNNFVVMSKNYLLPGDGDRDADMVLIGSNTQYRDGITENLDRYPLPNIIRIASKDKEVFNAGNISYTTRYIQRSYGNIRQASMVDKDKTWIYKPVLLWEVAGTEITKTINEKVSDQSTYVLGAMPLNTDLSDSVPQVVNHLLVNNTFDLGENVYWLTRFQGYFYANGEVIRYDAVEFNVVGTGNVWISNNQEYQNYFSTLPFNGKIYPTGLVRIYAEPYYETVDGVTRLQNGDVVSHGRGQFGTQVAYHSAGLSQYWSDNNSVRGCQFDSSILFNTKEEAVPMITTGAAGISNEIAKQSSRVSVIKNFSSSTFLTEVGINQKESTEAATVQSSALVFTGPSFSTTQQPRDYISYVYKSLNSPYKHFGTRMRIIGKIESKEERIQTPLGSTSYYQVPGTDPKMSINIGGGSGGLAVMLNPETNNGYFFEIVALTEGNISDYISTADAENPNNIYNIVFYKIGKDTGSSNAIPVKLWDGLASILVDDGRFTGQGRLYNEDNPTVYDLGIEYTTIGNTRRFFLYINNKHIATVDDENPLPIYNNMGLFVRGSSRCMFEHIYALGQNYSQNTVFEIVDGVPEIFGAKEINANESFRKYAMSGVVQQSFLSGISAEQPPQYNMYFEEFGTIMRECAYFNIRYDRAYPALYAQLSPTFNKTKGYTTSGFLAGSYGAEFLIFNATDTAISLDETSGNYLRIQGITFTQDTTEELTVDEYFKKKGNLSNPPLRGSTLIYSPLVVKEQYDQIKLSRINYGRKDFSLTSDYIQTQDSAEDLMGWIIEKVMRPRKNVGVQVFATPIIQLGDIVTIDYQDENGTNFIDSAETQFVVYNIEYSKSSDGPEMTLYLSEV